MMLSGCSVEREPGGSQQTAVEFTGNLKQILTRVGGTNGTEWHADDPVGIYMIKADPGTLSDGNIVAANKHHKATAGASASFAPGDGTHLFYPTDGSGVKFVAYHPHTTSVSADHKVPFSVADQSDLSAIDLLHAPLTASFSKSSTGAVPLVFAHKLTKLVFNVSNGTGVTEPVANGIEVVISGQQAAGTLDLATGDATASGAAGTITAEGGATIEAIVLPNADLSDVTFTFTNDAGQSFVVDPPTASWQDGKQYTYTVTLKAADSSSEITGSIDPWGDGGAREVTGNETIEAGAEPGKRSISFTADEPWTATVEESGNTRAGGSSVEWLKLTRGGVETYSGEAGTVTLDAELETNYSGAARSARITIAGGTFRTSYRITQSATTSTGETPALRSGTITMTTTLQGEWVGVSNQSVSGINLYGRGSATIDWGDGSTTTTGELDPLREEINYPIAVADGDTDYGHSYNIAGEKTITITGDITGLFVGHTWCITSIDLSGMPGLVAFTCDDEINLASLTIGQNPVLRDVEITNSNTNRDLSSLDLSGATGLIRLFLCDFPLLTSLDLMNNVNLRHLTLSRNGHTELDLIANNKLKYLNCSGNDIRTEQLVNILNQFAHRTPDPDDLIEPWPAIELYDNPGVGGPGYTEAKLRAEQQGWQIIEE